jgi:LMBR1 domain-containing protein 1
MVLLIVPFTIYYYEGEDNDDDPDGKTTRSAGSQFGYAIKYIIPTLLVFGGIVAGMYFGGLGYADIQTTYLQAPLIDTTDLELNSLDAFFSFDFYCNSTAMGSSIPLTSRSPLEANGTAPVFVPNPAGNTGIPGFGCTHICCKVNAINSVVASPIVFVVAVTTLVGWAIFSVFAGVGMAALPYDWLNDFKYRPKPITHAEYEERKKVIGQQAGILMEAYGSLSQELKAAARGNNFNKRYRALKKKENAFRKDVVILEYHYRNLEDSYRFQGGNILLQYFKFGCACLSVLLTLLWMVHIGLYVIPITLQMKGLSINPIAPFLNEMLNMTKDVPILGIGLYSMFIFYLLGCVLKGNAKLGMRLIFFTIHPLVYGPLM